MEVEIPDFIDSMIDEQKEKKIYLYRKRKTTIDLEKQITAYWKERGKKVRFK